MQTKVKLMGAPTMSLCLTLPSAGPSTITSFMQSTTSYVRHTADSPIRRNRYQVMFPPVGPLIPLPGKGLSFLSPNKM